MFELISLGVLLAQNAPLGGTPAVVDYAFGKAYVSRIPGEALVKSPRWSQGVDNPPVSAGKAIKIAQLTKERLLKDSEDFKWKLASLRLEQIGDGHWYWIVCYFAEFRGNSTGIPNQVPIVVLMDGTAVMPRVSSRP